MQPTRSTDLNNTIFEGHTISALVLVHDNSGRPLDRVEGGKQEKRFCETSKGEQEIIHNESSGRGRGNYYEEELWFNITNRCTNPTRI